MAVKKKATSTKAPTARKTSARKPKASVVQVPANAPMADAALPAAETAFDEMLPRAVEPVAAVEPAAEQPATAEHAPAPEIKPVTKKSKTSRYLLPTNMEIAALGPVHADLVALEASNDGPFILDGANLSVIDTAGLQLLISFVSAVQASGKKVSWDNYSVQAYQLANELGVVDQLGD